MCPTATFAALALAWPFDAARTQSRIAVGFALVQVYVAVSAALAVVLFLASDGVRAVELDAATVSLLRTSFEAFVVPPAMSYAVPALLLCAVVFAPSRHGWSPLGAAFRLLSPRA